MKVWSEYGSEHSANLVMIGTFKDVSKTEEVMKIIDELKDRVREDERTGLLKIGEYPSRFTDNILDLLGKLNVGSLSPIEVEQFAYDFSIEAKKNQIILTSEEYDVSAFFKLMLDKGARVEIYSAHDYPRTGYGRGG